MVLSDMRKLPSKYGKVSHENRSRPNSVHLLVCLLGQAQSKAVLMFPFIAILRTMPAMNHVLKGVGTCRYVAPFPRSCLPRIVTNSRSHELEVTTDLPSAGRDR